MGGLRPERTGFDVLRYDLNIKINTEEKAISGYNDISFKVVGKIPKMQLDLFENMQVDSIVFNQQKLKYQREFGAVFIDLPTELALNTQQKIRFYYSGKPLIAQNAPWDGGFVFTEDKSGKPWVAVAVQGTGASLWYPCKDSQSDEPDLGATVKVAVPNGLMNISNGRFVGSEDLHNGYTRWDWEVKNPINSYNITVNIGDYVHIHDNHKGLDLDYYVLRNNEAKARKHFEEVKPMLDCFQSKFGKYPFQEDGYKLVEAPYLGMEHQSAVAYGNNFLKGYSGYDLSGTGVGINFDYIVVHESAHEWFGNSITSRDIADLWIHEAFAMYSEVVFVECQQGYEKSQTYLNGMRSNVQNDKPIIGPYGVNKEGSDDMYYKGALMLNTVRHIINDDKKWWKILLKYSETYKHQIVDTNTVITFFNKESGINLTPVFNQYLKYSTIPKLEYSINDNKLEYRWIVQEENFKMPIDITIDGKKMRLYPTTFWKKSKFKIDTFWEIDVLTDDFYIETP